MHWAKDMAALDDIWLRQFKNAVLSMRLNEAEDEDIKTHLPVVMKAGKRIRQNTPEDVFQVYMNALTQTFDPHTHFPRITQRTSISA